MKKAADQYIFDWTPVDPNQQVAFETAVGKGIVTGGKVELWFTVQYPLRGLSEYAQINGWKETLNPLGAMNSPGCVSVTSVPQGARMVATNCFAFPDRIGFKDGANVMRVSDIQGQYVSGYITWLIE